MPKYLATITSLTPITVCDCCLFHSSHTHDISDDEVIIHFYCKLAKQEHESFSVKPTWCPLHRME